MAELRTDMGRDCRICRDVLPLLMLPVVIALAVSSAFAQAGPELVGAMPPANGQPAVLPGDSAMMAPGAASPLTPPGVPPQNVPPPANVPVGTPDGVAPKEMVVDVKVAGLKTLPLSRVLPSIRTRAGRPYDRELIQEDARRLDNTHLFAFVRPCYQQVPGGRVVVFELIERPLLQDVLFIGCKGIRKKTLQKEANIKKGDPADTIAIEDARRKLEQYYHEKGYGSARVTLLEGDKPEDRRAIFLVNEGTKLKIWNTAFQGNLIASDGRLRTQITTSRPFLYLFGGEFDRKKLDEDVDKLTAYYRGLGFFRARIGREVEYDEKQNWVTITFVIDEGPRYRVRNVSVVGNKKYSNDELLVDLKLKGGDYFNQGAMSADRNAIVDMYGSVGYVFADIKPDPRFLEEPAQLDLVYNIKEGDRYRVGKVNVVIKGEYPHTQLTTVMNRLSFKPGDIVDIREIRASERRIRASQLFEANPASGNAPKIVFNPPGTETKEVDDNGDKSRKNGRGRGVSHVGSRGPGGPSDDNPTYRGQSPDDDDTKPLVVTLDCGRYIGPQADKVASGQWPVAGEEGSGESGQWSVVSDQNTSIPKSLASNPQSPIPNPSSLATDHWPPTTAPPSLAPRPSPLAPELDRATRDLLQTLAEHPPRRGLIETQYSPNSGQTNPASVPPTRWAGNPTPAASDANTQAYAASTNAYPPSSDAQATQSAPAQPAPAYGQPWPDQAPQRPVQSPHGEYIPGPIFEQNSPFRGGPPDGGAAPYLPFDVNASETTTGRIMVGVGINSDAGLVGSVVLDEQNFDWTRWPRSWEDIRNGTAWRGAGQRFRLEAAPGIATTSGSQPVSRYMVTFQEPYLFNTQISLGLSGYYFNRQYTQYTDTRLGGRIATGYQFAPDLSGNIAYRGEEIKITNPIDPLLPALLEVEDRDLALHEFQATFNLDKRDNAFMATEGYLLTASVAEVLGSFQYPHAEIDIRKYFKLHERPDGSGRHVLSLAARAGVTGDDTPIYERYYAGGFSSLRGFQFRGVSPLELGPGTGQMIAVGGNFQLLASAEYLFPITADDMLHGVFFCDTGTVEPSISNWADNYRVAPGFGLRISVPAMGPAPIALDFAFPVSSQPGDVQSMFSFFVGFGR